MAETNDWKLKVFFSIFQGYTTGKKNVKFKIFCFPFFGKGRDRQEMISYPIKIFCLLF